MQQKLLKNRPMKQTALLLQQAISLTKKKRSFKDQIDYDTNKVVFIILATALLLAFIGLSK